MRVVTFATRAAARAQVLAINALFMSSPRPRATKRYLLLEQYADGAWGHVVDDYVRGLQGRTLGQSSNHVVDVAGERDAPTSPVSIGGLVSAAQPVRLARDEAGSDR